MQSYYLKTPAQYFPLHKHVHCRLQTYESVSLPRNLMYCEIQIKIYLSNWLYFIIKLKKFCRNIGTDKIQCKISPQSLKLCNIFRRNSPPEYQQMFLQCARSVKCSIFVGRPACCAENSTLEFNRYTPYNQKLEDISNTMFQAYPNISGWYV